MALFSRARSSPPVTEDIVLADVDPCILVKPDALMANAAAQEIFGNVDRIDDLQRKLPESVSGALRGIIRDTHKSIVIDEAVIDGSFFRVVLYAVPEDRRYIIVRFIPLGYMQGKLSLKEKEKDEVLSQYRLVLNRLEGVTVPLAVKRSAQLLWCNDSYASLFSVKPDDAIKQNKNLQLGRQHVVVNGGRRLIDSNQHVLPSGEVLLSALDITREEDLEGNQRRSQQAIKELLEQLHTAVMTFTGDQKLEFFNSSFAQLWDLEEAWLHTRPKLGEIMEKLREMRRLPEQADFKRFKQSWLDMFTGLLHPHEDMLHLPNGVTLRMTVVPNTSGGLMFTFEDVTSRLELEASYNTLLAVQKETLDNLAEGIAVFGGDGRIRLWNPSFVRLWGLNPEDLQGNPHITRVVQKLEDSFDPIAWSDARDLLLAQVLNGSEIAGHLSVRDGRMIAYATVVLPDGGVLVSHVDVTDTLRVENALREKNAALEAAERLKLDFLANVSYQLRTPLNAIMGFTDILDQEYFGKLNEKQKEYTAGVRQASERLLALIDDILDLSTIEAGYMKLDYDHVVIADLLSVLHGLTRDWARKEGVDVVLKMDDDPGVIEADPRRLKQCVLNLIRNAIDFTPAGGKIILSADRDGSRVYIRVTDTGIGLPAEELTRIFSPFEKGSSGAQRKVRSISSGSGAGLGLTLVRNIVLLHGGNVRAESQGDGKGTTMTIELPVTARLSIPVDNLH